jgi:hypothetical protein
LELLGKTRQIASKISCVLKKKKTDPFNQISSKNTPKKMRDNKSKVKYPLNILLPLVEKTVAKDI